MWRRRCVAPESMMQRNITIFKSPKIQNGSADDDFFNCLRHSHA